ncbi:uncharacterized protein BJ212DRAFT_1317085 [Suillus subaureus]|uniref:Inner centromere protein ARK-binding domain-containing protein n=1 Tax=Suillus subaureus TaxID=48587 RepID=A0A9P7JJN2_9AGAM|nr:uncharacterized protein BJ212DRAFT_1317085 [Suillus subaureus]KAG1825943.1 hypothetical protein BJ212DRAFT_1317085 [Suillus subaureus]
MAHPAPGIVAWTTSIRTSMAKDPCRQLFEDQVQTHGFIFLDDYLENILAGPKQEAIIDLVKTPARKKTAPKRTKVTTSAAAKAQNSILLSLEEEDISKENQPPVNNFHKALLHAKQNTESTRSHADIDCAEQILLQSKPAGTTVGEHVSHDPDLVDDDLAPEVEDTMVSPLDPLHSVPFESQKHARAREARTGNHTQPLPQIPIASSPIMHVRDALTAPLPILPASSSTPALTTMVVPLNDSPSRILAHKSSALQFPTLRAPSPLRKSMRVVVEPSAGAGILALAAPAPAQPSALGKRTSWLMKAREVKALEGIVHNKISILGPGVGTMGPSGNTAAPLKRKSSDMLATAPLASDKTDEGRRAKVAKASKSDSAPQNSEDPPLNQGTAMPTQTPSILVPIRAVHLPEEQWEPLNDKEEEASFIGVFKRTVEGLGARAGKSMGKSLGGGAAAVALAEARAAAEARVAERNKVNEEQVTESGGSSAPDVEEPQLATEDVHSRESERRLSISGVVSTNESPVALQSSSAADESVSTTPPNSPPPTRTSGSSFVPPPGPVFNRQPPPVFMPPIPKQIAPLTKEFSFNLPTATFTLPPPISLGLPARLTSPPSSRPFPQACGTQQSSQASTLSDAVFDEVEDTPAWMPSIQDTECTDGSESQIHRAKFATLEDDDDDSWPLEEKLAASEQGWTPFNFNNKEDSMTWSTLPTESQGLTGTRSDLTGNSAKNAVQQDEGHVISSTSAMDIDGDIAQVQDNESSVSEPEADHESVMYTSDLGDVLKAGQPTVTPIESGGIPRSESQLSMASTSSSSQQSQGGFFGQATKLVNSMLGTGKKAKPEVKSLQLAAAAGEEEEEANKKATRLKEMEARRQAALARKADEEKSRAVEEDKKIKEESEKRKRERDETTEKRPLKTPAVLKKTEEDATKKRKVTMDDKKPDVKKPPSKDKKDTLLLSKLAKSSLVTPAAKVASTSKNIKVPASSALVSSATYNASQNAAGSSAVKSTATEAKSTKVGPPKGKAKAVPQENEDKLPSAMVQNQMAARAMAQIRAAKQQPPEVPSESIELPDINSEYSDSEDEDRPRTFDPPDWAQSPELRQALQMQSTVDPDDIFGAIRPLRMEELFRTRQSRFRARTSSANWSGSDRLTVEEEREYARRMGFTKHAS